MKFARETCPFPKDYLNILNCSYIAGSSGFCHHDIYWQKFLHDIHWQKYCVLLLPLNEIQQLGKGQNGESLSDCQSLRCVSGFV